jgi:hypothetical protein
VAEWLPKRAGLVGYHPFLHSFGIYWPLFLQSCDVTGKENHVVQYALEPKFNVRAIDDLVSNFTVNG